MRQLFKLRHTLLVASLAAPFVADAAQAQFQIDAFTNFQSVEDTTDDSSSVSGSVVNDGSFLGGVGATRQFILNVDAKDGGAAPSNGIALISGSSELNFNGDSGVLGTGQIIYSGGDLVGGIDITDGGTLDAIRLDIQSSNVPFNLVFDATDTSSNTASFTQLINPVFVGPQSDSIALSNFGGVDLTNLSELSLTFDLLFDAGTDTRINLVETFNDPNIPDPIPDPDPDPQPTPEPGSMLGLLAIVGGSLVSRRRRNSH